MWSLRTGKIVIIVIVIRVKKTEDENCDFGGGLLELQSLTNSFYLFYFFSLKLGFVFGDLKKEKKQAHHCFRGPNSNVRNVWIWFKLIWD